MDILYNKFPSVSYAEVLQLSQTTLNVIKLFICGIIYFAFMEKQVLQMNDVAISFCLENS